jgi:hypothetical protein
MDTVVEDVPRPTPLLGLLKFTWKVFRSPAVLPRIRGIVRRWTVSFSWKVTVPEIGW